MPDHQKLSLSPSVSILLSGVLIAAAIVFVNLHPAAAPQAAAAAVAPTKLDIRLPSSSDHLIGSSTAPVVLVEYSDFQCPFCSMIYPTLKNIVNASNGQVAWVQRSFPLTSIHPNANPAANAAECVAALGGNDDYWKFADAVFADQSKLSDSYYQQLATQFGIDPAKFAKCYSASTYQNVIDTDSAEAQKNGGQGTPFTVVVNTKTGKMVPLSGALPQSQIEQVINSIK